ncbi:6-phosphofructokinase [Anaerobacillus sp. MEB173]|uniref:6-phosphofructokinase n=1 Tax=Anaerobacillus sp. MEB173 TaxID=3383345 RepID=UPI003F8F31FA
MKVGIINIGSFTSGVNQLLRTIISRNTEQKHTFIGIEIDRENREVALKELELELLKKSEKFGEEQLLHIYPSTEIENNFYSDIATSSSFDAIVIIGDDGSDRYDGKAKRLYVPTSIYNDIPGSTLSLGYDSALNSVVTSILQIKDTAKSMIYEKPRVFCVQVPGTSPNSLLSDSALAVSGMSIINEMNDDNYLDLKRIIETKYAKNETYSFLLINEAINPEVVKEKLSHLIDTDFKLVKIDEAQCLGPYPTAIDRVLSVKLANHIFDWVDSIHESGRLLVKEQQIIFSK